MYSNDNHSPTTQAILSANRAEQAERSAQVAEQAAKQAVTLAAQVAELFKKITFLNDKSQTNADNAQISATASQQTLGELQTLVATLGLDGSDQAVVRRVDLGNAAYRSVGTTTGTVAAGDDVRLTNARTPTPHATSHAPGQSDEIHLKTINGESLFGTGNIDIVSGGGDPVAGSDTYVQFNDGGAMGADAGLVFVKATGALTVGGNISSANFSGSSSGANTGDETGSSIRTKLGITTLSGANTGDQDLSGLMVKTNNLSDLTSVSSARTNLGLGTLAVQNASSVSISGGTLSGLTGLALRNAGTGVYDVSLGYTGTLTTARSLTFDLNDSSRTISLGGNLTTSGLFATSGANSLTLTTTAATNVTLPTTGTLATLAGAESLTNKKLGSLTSNGLVTASGGDGTLSVTAAASSILTFLTTPTSANLAAAVTDETGSGALVFATSPTLITPNLGTPSSLTLSNATGLPIATGVSGLGAGISTFLSAPSSANLLAAVTDETGSGALVFATSPALSTPAITGGTLSALTSFALRNAGTGAFDLAIAHNGTLTAGRTLTIDVNDAARTVSLSGNMTLAAAFTTSGANALTLTTSGTTNVTLPTTGTLATVNGALGTPASVTLTNATGLPVSTGISGLGTGVSAFLAAPSSANLIAAVTDETGSGNLVFSTSPVLSSPTVTGGALTALTGLAIRNAGTGAFDLTFAHNGTLTAGRALTLNVNDAARALNLSGDLTVSAGGATVSGTHSGTSSGTNTGDQNTFTSVVVSGQTTVTSASTTQALTLVAGANTSITTDNASKSVTINSTITPGGSDTYVQFNDGGVMSGTENMTFNKSTNVLTTTGGMATAALTATSLALSGNATLVSSAANVLEQRNGANAQTLYLYDNYGSAVNYVRGELKWVSNEFVIEPTSGGTLSLGGADVLHLKSGNNFKITSSYGAEVNVTTDGWKFLRGSIRMGSGSGFEPTINLAALSALPAKASNQSDLTKNLWLAGMDGASGFSSATTIHQGTGAGLYAGAGGTPSTAGANGGNAGVIELRLNAGGAGNGAGSAGSDGKISVRTGASGSGTEVARIGYDGGFWGATLTTTGNATVGGTLNVQGNSVYIGNSDIAFTIQSAGTSARVDDGAGNLRDLRMRNLITAGAANLLTLAGASTGNDVTLTASGSDTNVGINVVTQAAGTFKVNGNAISGVNSGDQNVFSSIAVSGQTTVSSASTSGTLTLVAGANVTLTTDNTAKTVTITSTAAGGGGGTVTNTAGSLTANAVVLGAGAADTKVSAGVTTDGASKLNLGVAGSSVGAVAFANATSGSVTLQPVTGALGAVTLSLPAATDTLVGRATVDTLTNKTLTSPTIVGGAASGLTSFGLRSSGSGAFDLTLNNSENLTADRSLTLTLNNAARTIDLSGNLTVSSTATISGTNTGDQTITLTGDATGTGTGSFAVTVGKINGVALSGLPTGILKNTTTTGVLSIALAADFPTLNQSTTGNAATATALQTARAINGVNFDGTAPITVPAAAGTLTGATLASGVTSSSLTSFGTSPALTTPTITGGALTALTTFALRNAGTGAFDVTVGHNGTLTAGRALTLDLNDAARTISLSGNLTVGSTASVSGTNTGDQTITLTGDATGSGTGSFAVVVAKINGVSLSGLATGLLKNTTTTGAPSIAIAGTDYLVPNGAFGTPTSLTLTNATGLPISTGVAGLGTGVSAFLATPSSANLLAALTDETGTGSLVFSTSPALTTPAITGGTLSAITGFALRNIGTGAFDMTETHNGVLTAGRTLTWNLNDAARTVSLSGNLTVTAAASVSGTNTGDQDLSSLVVGPASAVDNRVAFFNGTTGKLIKDSGLTLSGTNTGDQTITLTGDATGSGTGSFAVAVVKINGVSLAALGTGILKNTTATGVPSIAVAGDFPTLNQSTTGNAATATKLQTARAINGVNFDGTADITVTAAAGTLSGATLAAGVTGSSLTSFGASPTLTSPTIGGGTHTAITSLGIRSTGSGAFDLTLANSENLTAGRTLTLALGDAARTLTLTGNASIAGTNTGDQTITLTSDVTGTGTGSFATTIAAGAVTLAKMANLAANSIIGNNTGAGATPIALTASQVKTLLAIANTDVSGLGTLSTQNASAAAITGGTIAGLTGLAIRNAGSGAFDMTVAHNGTLTAGRALTFNVNDAARTVSLSGDLTVSGAATISGTHSGTSSGTNTGDQNLFSSFVVSGQTTVTTGSATQALTLVAGTNITITTDNTAKSITISAASGGTGTVTNTGGNLTANSVVLGAGTVDAKVVAGITTDGTSKLNLGVAGASVGAVAFANATSGTVTLQPVTGALGTVTLSLPAISGTLATLAGTETLSNKTLTSPALNNTSLTGAKVVNFDSEYSNGNSGASITITLANGQYQSVTLNSATPTITISTTGAGVGTYALRIIQDATGGRVPTLSGLSSSRWLGAASAPGINLAVNGETLLTMRYDGTNLTQTLAKIGAA